MLADWYTPWYKIRQIQICTKALEIAKTPLNAAVSGKINEVATGIPSFTPILIRPFICRVFLGKRLFSFSFCCKNATNIRLWQTLDPQMLHPFRNTHCIFTPKAARDGPLRFNYIVFKGFPTFCTHMVVVFTFRKLGGIPRDIRHNPLSLQ